ncbi:PAS domain S-box protein [Paracnuella aquatica]|nr:PAS domain S-box protein [Paracnuella aquatica]
MSFKRTNSGNLFVVAVGASAGGLEAIHEFFDHIPDSSNLCFVIIQHLSSDHKSLLVELVAKHTHMHVAEARHGAEVRSGCVYVIPNNKLLSIANGKLQLSEKEQERGPNLAIDHFLYSLANEMGENAIAVILSGTGSDGTRGGEAIREAGGFVLVQEPGSAKFDGMPISAIQAGIADLVLPPHAMSAPIYRHIDYVSTGEQPAEYSNVELTEILNTVHQSTGYDFRQYKPATILRRISRRIANTRSGNMAKYAQLLAQNEEESRQLAREFFIGVTAFFRDMDAFNVLRDDILPRLVADKPAEEGIKIWVTACSTGQEAYSLAILVAEFLKEIKQHRDVKIFATDIDDRAVEVAAKGKYPVDMLQHVPEDYRDEYFVRQGNQITIVPHIRKQIVFARHNILKDPPFIKNDLVTCRNLLIYLNPKLQEGVMSTLHFSLNKGGFLFLGPSENPSVLSPELEEVNSRWKIYRKKGLAMHYPYGGQRQTTRNDSGRGVEYRSKPVAPSQIAGDFAKSLADDFGYAAVYVNEQYEVKEVIGDFRRYLSLPDKLVNLNILRMVPIELSGLLNSAFRKVTQERQKLVFRNTKLHIDGKARTFQLMVYPPGANNCILVVLGEAHGTEGKPEDEGAINVSRNDQYVRDLEEELQEARLNLQMAVEGLETTNEELQSANEELQSANEELQSSNEELQSLNEELHTLNTEHQMRIRELKTLNDDLNNYFRSTEIGQIFLDGNLCIRRFNPAAVQMINMLESDIGRPISDISTNILYADLYSEIIAVLNSDQTVEREVELTTGLFCLMKIMPYLRHDGKQDGVVITFVDLTAIRNLDKIIKGVFDTTSSAILVFDAVREKGKIADYRCTAANYAAQQLLDTDQQPTGLLLYKELKSLHAGKLHERLTDVVETGQSLRLEVSLNTTEGVQWFSVMANRLNDGAIIAFNNITPLKASEEKLRKNYNELLRTKESLKELNAQLEEKVTARTQELSQSEERFRLVASATNDAIWDWDLSDNHVWWSDSFYTLFGYDPADTKIQTASFWVDAIHPDDRQRVKDDIYGLINGDGGKGWNNEYRLRRADGSYAVILDRGSIMKDEWGVPYRMLGAMMDVTEATATRQQLQSQNEALETLIREFSFVTDFMPQIVWATREDGYHDFFNRQWYDYTGTTFEQAMAEGWSLVLHPNDYEHTLAVWKHSLRTGDVYETEYRLRRHDGVYRWFLARAHPMHDEQGRILKWFGTCTDIHDQKLMNEVLEQKVAERTRDLQVSNKELELSNNELMQFASIASHDLKEPLRKIQIFSSLVKERYFEGADPGITAHLDRIIQASSRMTRLINDLLDYSRLSANSFFQATDLNQLLKEVLNDIELAIGEKDATVETDAFPVIDAIPGQMRQIFQNLISNSLKFTAPHRRPVIRITCSRVGQLSFDAPEKEDGAFCRISLRDNGIGFDKQYEQKIFVIFQRLHTRENYEGTGIGLAIVKKIVERHGGIITAVGRENEGAEFVFILPMHQQGLPQNV